PSLLLNFFLLTMCPIPTPHLFPYTTLFRSAVELNPYTAVNDYANILSTPTEDYIEDISVALQDTCGAQIGVYTTEYIGNSTMEGDRKSTRLNSSHVSISYAVFCLNKNKTTA